MFGNFADDRVGCAAKFRGTSRNTRGEKIRVFARIGFFERLRVLGKNLPEFRPREFRGRARKFRPGIDLRRFLFASARGERTCGSECSQPEEAAP